MRTFQIYGIVELAHFSGPIHNDLIESSLDALLEAAQQSHVWEKQQPAVVRGLIESLYDAVQ